MIRQEGEEMLGSIRLMRLRLLEDLTARTVLPSSKRNSKLNLVREFSQTLMIEPNASLSGIGKNLKA